MSTRVSTLPLGGWLNGRGEMGSSHVATQMRLRAYAAARAKEKPDELVDG